MKCIKKLYQKYKTKREDANYVKIKKQILAWAVSGKILDTSNSINKLKKNTLDLNNINCQLRILGFDLADAANTTLFCLKKIEDGDLDAVNEAHESLSNMFVTLILLAEGLGIDSSECISKARKKKENISTQKIDPERDSYIETLMNNDYS
tara:strand:+ start:422 stop:874 length:453 start_codon:yes stop_codon:yes gene_type:complete